MYSERYKTIFVHIPRTGGQSVETLFLDKHGLKWGTRAALLLRHNDDPGLGPGQLAHLLAREYVSCGHLTQDEFDACYKFAVVRNPYDRILSQYRYKKPGHVETYRDFVGFLEKRRNWRHGVPQADFVVDESGKTMVDTIVRFESLAQEFPAVTQRVFGEAIALPHVNKARTEPPPETENPEIKRRLYKLYERDFELFQYPSGL